MKLMPLTQHITEIFGWPAHMLKTEGLDFAEGDRPAAYETRQHLQDAFEKIMPSRWKL
ncbi:hypothetical protein [Niabella hibiscisoli]|uniref:hypothetical protein n=1 Tax=Niabella hibiscisoli TaxID=1825928 RepID=UPI001F111189|nr:hypothetical protein [Niabella hibiscisoli]MCH5714758.1 hypothetical protein [Niabella hibiscisoli]